MRRLRPRGRSLLSPKGDVRLADLPLPCPVGLQSPVGRRALPLPPSAQSGGVLPTGPWRRSSARAEATSGAAAPAASWRHQRGRSWQPLKFAKRKRARAVTLECKRLVVVVLLVLLVLSYIDGAKCLCQQVATVHLYTVCKFKGPVPVH